MRESVHFTVDGESVAGRPGETVLEAAERAGHWIPRLCHLHGITPHGACRLCTCFVDGRPQAACTFPVTEGIEVENDSPRLHEFRKRLVEMLLVEGDHYCMFCEASGECELQALAYRFGVTHPRYRSQWSDRGVDASHPEVWIDRHRCVQCGRCVRVSAEIDGKHVFQFTERGARQRVAVNAAEGLVATDVSADDAAIDACPVGALLRKHEGYTTPIGRRRYDALPIGAEIERRRTHDGEEDGR